MKGGKTDVQNEKWLSQKLFEEQTCRRHTSASLNVRRNVDFVRQLRDVDIEAVLNFVECLGICLVGDKGHCQSLGAETTSSGNPVEVGVRVLGHVVVENNVDPLNVHASAKQVCGHKDSLLKILELLIPRQPLLLIHGTVDGNGRKVLFHQKLCQRHATLHSLHKDDHLVELEQVKKLKQLAVLLVVLQLHVVLLQAVQSQLCFIIHVHLHRLKDQTRHSRDTLGTPRVQTAIPLDPLLLTSNKANLTFPERDCKLNMEALLKLVEQIDKAVP